MKIKYITLFCLAAVCVANVNANVYLGTNVVYSSSSSTTTGLTSGLRVRYFDYDGTLLSTQFVATNGNATAPANPSHDLLTFVEWNVASTGITQNTDIGATYRVTDGKTYVYLTVDTVTGTNCTLYLNKSDASTLTVDWGDGATSNYTASGNFNSGAHAYPSNGNYVVSMSITSGTGTYGFGNGTDATSFCGGNAQTNRDMLSRVLIGTNVTALETSAFDSSFALNTVMLPRTLTSVGVQAFYNCHSLNSVTLPSGITSVPSIAFLNCYALSSVIIPSTVTTIGSYAFCTDYALQSVALPKNLTTLAANAFNTASGLESVTVPNGVSDIAGNVFYNCTALTSVTLPNSATNIGASAFDYCYALNSVTVPSNVLSIGANAFRFCNSARFYNLLPTNPPTLANVNAFSGIHSACKIYVPDASYDIYTNAAVWSNSPVPLLYLYKISAKP